MDYINIMKLISFIVSFAVSIAAIVAVILKKMNTDGKYRTDYDERQNAIIGKGYAYAFDTAVACFAAMMMIDITGIEVPLSLTSIAFLSMIISTAVCCVYRIWKGAYFGQNSKKKSYTVLFLVIAIINIVVFAVNNHYNGGDDEVLNGFVNLVGGIFFLAIVVAVFIADKKEKMLAEMAERDDDDETEEGFVESKFRQIDEDNSKVCERDCLRKDQ